MQWHQDQLKKGTRPHSEAMNFSVQNIQIDNQLLTSANPVVLTRRHADRSIKPHRQMGLLHAAKRDVELRATGPPMFHLQWNKMPRESMQCFKCVQF